ncbi:MAG: ABC transporter transmembrane domain-containing protein [Saccharofermentanales bacterium]
MMHDILNLFKISGKGRQFGYLLLLRSPIIAIQTVILAKFLQFAFLSIDRKSTNDLYFTCLYFGIGCLLLFLYNGSVWIVFATCVIRWECIIRKKLFEHISRFSLQQIEEKSSGDWFTFLNADVRMAAGILGPNSIPHAIMSIAGFCLAAILLLIINPMIYMLVLLFIIPNLLLNILFIARPMTALSTKSQEATAENTADINAFISCAEIAILYDAHDNLMKQFEESSLNIRKINMRIIKRNAIGGVVLLMMGMSGFFTILLIGSVQISAGFMTFGDLTAAFQYRNGIFAGTIMLINSIISIRAALAGVRRYNETMQIQTEG